MSVLDSIIGIIAPHECLDCATEGSLLCDLCAQAQSIPQEITNFIHLERVQAAALYQGAAKDLTWKLKSAGAKAAAKVMAAQMVKRLRLADETILVPVPTATGRVRERGYDQARLLARELASQANLPYLDCLARAGQTHQVGSSREQRLQQLQDSFYIKKTRLIRGAHITLVDDVVTTGSTLEAAAKILKTAGIKRLEAITFAQAPLEPRH